jgi:hypothetical protein
MKKVITATLLLGCIVFINDALSQSKQPPKQNHPSGKQYSVSLGTNLPLGNFSSTHVTGIEINHAWCNHRFGMMDVKPVKPVGFIGNVGGAYYFGKKERIIDYYYDYPSYTFLHAFAGVIYNPGKKTNVNLTAGPALGIYNSNKKFNIGCKLEGNYYFSKKFGITPCLVMMKESGAEPLWAASLKATMGF